MIVEISALTKRYRDVVALDGCNLRIQRGEVFGLLGPNGAGKSTLLRLLMGFLQPTSGSARIHGLDCYAQSVEVHRRVAYLPGDVRLFRGMRARQLLKFFCDVRGNGRLDRAIEIAQFLDLRLTARVNQMSTGMRQKLALAATLSAQTELIILDEPTSNLDPNVRSRVAQIVRTARDEGRTVFFSSHVLSEVEETCDRVAILRAGRLVHMQVLAQLKRQHRIVAQLHGPLPEVPESFRGELTIQKTPDGRITLVTPGELQPLLGWLATLPIEEVQIEPIGLRAVYDEFHPPLENLAQGPNTLEKTATLPQGETSS